jgi:hypothetical protein
MLTEENAGEPGLSFVRAWVYAGLTIAVVDIADALIFYGMRGVAPHLIFQSIASGLLGRAAFSGGLGTEVLGGAIHLCIALTIAFVYLAASTRLRTLAQWPWVWGPVYGLAVWFVMYHLVLPHSGANPGAQKLAVVADEIGIHLFGVGLPAALFAARVRRSWA